MEEKGLYEKNKLDNDYNTFQLVRLESGGVLWADDRILDEFWREPGRCLCGMFHQSQVFGLRA